MAVWIDKKYLNLLSPQLELFKWKSGSIANHRCPICGDSKKKKTKCRGYHFEKEGGMFYKCHNCQASMSTGNFIKLKDPNLWEQYRLERYKNGDNKYSNYKKPVEKYKSEEPVFNENKRRIIDSILDRLDTLPNDNIAVKYVLSRSIPRNKWSLLYYIDDIHKMENFSEKTRNKFPGHEPRLIIPFEDRNGMITGFTARSLIDCENQKRYLNGIVRENGPMIFGLSTVDFNKPIIVVEGPIDSLFLPNAVAAGGSNLKQISRFLPKNRCILVFDYQPRNKELCKIIKQAINLGFKVSLLPDDFPGKDINDAINSGLTSEEIYSIIRGNENSGAMAHLKFSEWKKVK